jgi:myo-inositol-1(or 4)-monophosphatase
MQHTRSSSFALRLMSYFSPEPDDCADEIHTHKDMYVEIHTIMNTAVSAAREAAGIICHHFNTIDTAATKAPNDLVTDADLQSEKAIIEHIRRRFPSHQVLGEESSTGTDVTADNLWIVDPLDGTNNFAHGIPHFCISIAFAHHGRVECGCVYDPLREELFTAIRAQGAYMNDTPIHAAAPSSLAESIIICGFHYERGVLMEQTIQTMHRLFVGGIRGIRRTGSAALDLCWVAAGRMDAFFQYRLSPWDFAAGRCIVEEAGGICSDAYAHPLTLHSEGIIACASSIAQECAESITRRDHAAASH